MVLSRVMEKYYRPRSVYAAACDMVGVQSVLAEDKQRGLERVLEISRDVGPL